MSAVLKIITLALVSVTLMGGCTKRKLTNKDKAKAKPTNQANQVTKKTPEVKTEVILPPVDLGSVESETQETGTQSGATTPTEAANQTLTNSAPEPQSAPLVTPAMPIVSPAPTIASNTSGTATPTATKPTLEAQPAASQPVAAKPEPTTVAKPPVEIKPHVQPPLKPVVPMTKEKDINSCILVRTKVIHSTWVGAGNTQLKPSLLETIKQLVLDCAKVKQAPTGLNEKIAEAFTKAFPNSEYVAEVFLAIEASNLSAADKKKLYTSVSGRSGVEIESKGVQFFGPLDKAKTSATVISYTINRFTGSVKNTVIKDGKTDAVTINLKNAPQPNERYIFDFSAAENGYFPLHIGDGETKITVFFKFMKGNLEDLKAGKTVTIILSLDSWGQVIEEEMRKLLASKAKELLEKGFDLAKDPKNSILVRTCNLNANSIACTDPDYKSSATVSLEETVKMIKGQR